MNRPDQERFKRSGTARALPLMVMGGLMLSVIAYFALNLWETSLAEQRTRIAFYSQASEYIGAIRQESAKHPQAIRALKAFYDSSQSVTRQEFRTFTTILLESNPSIQALEWIPRVVHSERAHYEEKAREFASGFRITERREDDALIPATARAEYYPVYFVEPYTGNEPALGFDLASESVRRETLLRARDTGELTASGRITLVQETGQQHGLVMYLPIYRKGVLLTSVAERRQNLEGFVLGVCRLSNLVEQALAHLSGSSIDIWLVDITADPQVLYAHLPQAAAISAPRSLRHPPATGLLLSEVLQVGGRQWKIIAAPAPGHFIPSVPYTAWVVLVAALVITGLLAGYLNALQRYTGRLLHANRLLDSEVSERRHTEAALRASETKFRQILESAAEAIIISDERGRILITNGKAEQLFGYTRRELIGQPVELLVPEGLREKYVAHRRDFNIHPRARPMGQDIQLLGRRKDGTHVPLEISLSPLYRDEKLMVTAIIRDITLRKQAENKLAKAKETAELANKSKSRFLTAASHDLRQPVQAIVSYTDLLAISNTDPALASTIQHLRNATLAMQVLLEGLLDISKMDTGTMRPEIRTFSISSLLSQIQELHQPIAMEKGITLKLVPCTAVVNSDPTLLRVILQNLISNAIKYTHRGKVILGCRHRGDQLRIEVWDSGIGIPEDKQKSVFEEFYQIDNPGRDRNKGIGIGLTIVKRIATLLNHELYMHSVVGKGSSFTIQVPLVDNAREETHAEQPGITKFDDDSMVSSILLIDDDEIVLHANYSLLEALGYKVIPACDAEAAMHRVESETLPPDIIITDYRLSGGCVGTELVQQLRTKAGSQIPVIILTGDITLPDENSFLPDNSLLIQKPARVEELVQAINQLLGDPVASAE